MQDLFADPNVRGEGIGRKLIEAVYALAKDADCEQVYWMTQNHNKTARLLYDRIADDNGFMVYEKHQFHRAGASPSSHSMWLRVEFRPLDQLYWLKGLYNQWLGPQHFHYCWQ